MLGSALGGGAGLGIPAPQIFGSAGAADGASDGPKLSAVASKSGAGARGLGLAAAAPFPSCLSPFFPLFFGDRLRLRSPPQPARDGSASSLDRYWIPSAFIPADR